ncbi:hypothetical protein [Glaciecola sp. MF2-115]|uniref:hypothetical protein n=1 Tax=Glaciecola sp. MF2-115 TaxID=3384827 RepID=UPI0039A34695
MKTLSLFILSTAFICMSAFAKDLSVDVKNLGALSLKTDTIEPVSSYSGKDAMAKVFALPGQSYVFKSPIDVQQLEYLKGSGDPVDKNEAFAIIQGPEVHHFHRLYELKKTLYMQSKALFDNNRKLYERKAISEQVWLDISVQFHETKMEYDELTHFFDLVLSVDDEKEALTLASPVAGIIQYNATNIVNSGNTIALFTPMQAIRLQINLPIDVTQKPLFVRSEYCQLEIDFTENANSPFYQTAWSKPIASVCNLVIGQMISVRPEYQTQAYKIKQSSVFNWEGLNYVFVKNEQNFSAVKVILMTSDDDSYVVKSTESLADKKVLVTSVSAVQGILLGMGL